MFNPLIRPISQVLVLLAFCIIGWATPAFAENRVLLVGVGQYKDALITPLPGVEVDLEMMREVAQWMGFSPNQIKVLKNEQVTQEELERSFREWLVQGVTANDRVLIYFTGHGTSVPDLNGDEEDGVDEFLVLHDSAHARDGQGRASMIQGLLDDRFRELLSAIPSQQKLVIIDACHSGTATRGMALATRSLSSGAVLDGVVKSHFYEGMPTHKQGGGFLNVTSRGISREGSYVAISAARDDEKSIATRQGSLFTLALHQAVQEVARKGETLTPRLVQERTTRFISNQLTDQRHLLFHPTLDGDQVAFDTDLSVIKISDPGDTWLGLSDLVDHAREKLVVTANQSCYRYGEPLRLTVTVPRRGYLNVVAVDAEGSATVLFPNKHHSDNRVEQGSITLPTDQMKFQLPAQKPAGQTVVMAVLFDKPNNLYLNGFREGQDLFSSLSPAGKLAAKGLGVDGVGRESQHGLAAGKVELKIQATACP